METNQLSPSITNKICKHMNAEHPKALIEYAKRYGGIIQPRQVKMTDLNPKAMKLEVDGETIQIPFDHILIDRSDAHKTLIAMLNEEPEET